MSKESSSPRYLILARRLRAEILAGRYPVGSRLPGELELARDLEVGRASIREALRVLAAQGLIQTTRGTAGGSTVRRVDHRDVIRMLGEDMETLAALQGCSVQEMEEVEELLEVSAAWLAASRRTPVQLAKLWSHIPTIEPGQTPTPAQIDTNLAFHYDIVEATGNRMLHLFAEPVSIVIHNHFRSRERDVTYYQQVLEDHRHIAAAIQARDAEGARDEMQRHLSHLRSGGKSSPRGSLGGLSFGL
ncbi:FCD domain-containing protein [Nocardioides sp. 31GB23]|uniref:FadR/GntR family transcriptional regulator n=1 Tax=Nocardioides sp. 31GB23 TaxID=3156065 RepID=UPI0032AF3712